jgi:tetratricopeptide (TPR) repeat protein
MPSKKISRKKLLKEPDEFISTTGRVFQWLKTHRRSTARLAIIGLVMISAGAGAFYYLRWQEGKALGIQHQAFQLFQDAYRQSMESSTAEGKDEFKKALNKFQESLSVHDWGRSAQVSHLYMGHCHFALKEYDQAKAAYAKSLEGPFRFIALNGIAYCFEAQGDYDRALEYFQKNSGESSSPYQVESLLGAARCFEALKQKPKALEIYQKALAQAPQSPMAEFIRWKLSDLRG